VYAVHADLYAVHADLCAVHADLHAVHADKILEYFVAYLVLFPALQRVLPLTRCNTC
jgi:hypothetical protein